MTYFAPYLDSAGLHLPTFNDMLAKRIADAKSIFGQDIYLGNDSADYQLIAVETLALYDAMQAIQLAYNQTSPSTAIGVGLSSLVQLNGIRRIPASYSTCDVTLIGTTAANIINGVVADVSGNLWNLPTPIQLQAAGSPLGEYYALTVTATCQTLGAITALAGDINTISTPTAGWTSVSNATSAIAGQAVETDSELRERQRISVALPSQTMLAGTIAAIAAISSVTRYRVYENPTNATTYGYPGVPFEGSPQHSITAVVEGGDINDIAQAIYDNRGLGCYTNGDVETNIPDPYSGAITPIRFYRPDYVPIYVEATIKTMAGWVAEDEDEIKEAIADYINTLWIGEPLAASSVICAGVSVMDDKASPTFSIRSLLIGTTPSPATSTEISIDYKEVALGDVAYINITVV